jgi:hypothetical protein
MTIEARVSTGISVGGVSIDRDRPMNYGQVLQINEPIADQVTDGLVACTVDISQLKAVTIESDQDVTLETNDGSAADDTFALLANVPLFWTSDYLAVAGIFSADITALYVTNDSGSTANFKATFIVDPTV